MRVIVPCWPTRASSVNHTSTGLSATPSGSAAFMRAGSRVENRLRLGLGLRMLRSHREAPELQLAQPFADRALMHRDVEFGTNPLLKIHTAPAHHPVLFQVRTSLDPCRQLGPLLGRQPRGRSVAARPVRQPVQTKLVVAV